ncbi:MFS transporter [Uliginosibacterium aquaticum]|uniref:MFS transporter n=1 Tax=Uliginosibacterium aquaticum TaxID=2731212 RepID=A0ABX2IDN0_9RHOO|nr:MFS transporter [Uliginosibacterium aquaticum]NSL54573.1 MFS transporter [Uliginosibacterium aquaticum]
MPASAASGPSSLRPRLLALAAVTSVEFIENGMVMFSASQIMAGLQFSAADFAFAYTLYGMAAIFMLYKHQWMVERLGYERFVMLSLAVFGAGSLLCASASGLSLFAAGRLLQGLGGATFFTAGRLAINEMPAESRFAGLLVFIASLLGGSALAPLLSASLMALGGWRAIFAFGLPQVLIVAWLARGQLARTVTPPELRSEEHWGWLLWLCLGVFCLQYAIQSLSLAGSPLTRVLVTALVSIAMLSVFAWRQWRKDRPLINYRGLFQLRYLFGLAMYFFGYFLIGVAGLMLPILLHGVLGLSLLATALVSSCGLAGTVAMALTHVALARRWPWHRCYMLGGLALYATGCLLLAMMELPRGWVELLPATLAIYLAIPWFLGPVAFGTFSGLEAKVFSHGYQVKNIVRQLGLSSSIALTTLLLHRLEHSPASSGLLQTLAGVFVDQAAGTPMLQASQQVFGLTLLAILPVGLVVMLQRVFR